MLKFSRAMRYEYLHTNSRKGVLILKKTVKYYKEHKSQSSVNIFFKMCKIIRFGPTHAVLQIFLLERACTVVHYQHK